VENKSLLCVQVHFEQSQYEQGRVDGRKLLKSVAVPKLFTHQRHTTVRLVGGNGRKRLSNLSDHCYYASSPKVARTVASPVEVIEDVCVEETVPVCGETVSSHDQIYVSEDFQECGTSQLQQGFHSTASTPLCTNSRCDAIVRRLKMKVRQLQREVINIK